MVDLCSLNDCGEEGAEKKKLRQPSFQKKLPCPTKKLFMQPLPLN